MEQNNILELVRPSESLGNGTPDSSQKAFITANTVESSLEMVRNEHIIPVFTKDNEPLISHSEFVEAMQGVAKEVYSGEHILSPSIRLSHAVKGRIPSAKDKSATELEEWEKTLYYERMMFVIEIPSIQDEIDGNRLSLTVGGVKAYNKDNLYSRALSDQHFKIFAGFQNKVCSNLCVWSDGYVGDLKVKNVGQLKACIRSLLEGYNSNYHLFTMKKLLEYSITEQQFAHLIGRCRMYQHLPENYKTDIPQMLFGDQQMGAIVKDFYRKDSRIRDVNGNINLWKLYNLFTGVNKSSYIDTFMDRSVNAFSLVEQIKTALDEKQSCWYLN